MRARAVQYVSMQKSKALWLLICVLVAAATYAWMRPAGARNPLVETVGTSLTVLNPARPFVLEPPPAGWHHRRFWFTPPMQLSFGVVEGVPALKCETDAGGSIYARNADIDLARFSVLTWKWRVEVGISPSFDERTTKGDDHPVRWYIAMRDSEGVAHRFEIIWSNGAFAPGEYKYIGTFAHFVADGGAANVGRWRDERADLLEIYRTISKRSDVPRLTSIGVFCDSDNTRQKTVAFIGETRLQHR